VAADPFSVAVGVEVGEFFQEFIERHQVLDLICRVRCQRRTADFGSSLRYFRFYFIWVSWSEPEQFH